MDPRSGAIRALASRPNFDPNIFSEGPTTAQWNDLNRPEAPMLNRAFQGFPPASTFKVVTTIAGMESGQFGPRSTLPTVSQFCYDGQCYGDHGAFGFSGFQKALAVSSNSFYYLLGLKVGAACLCVERRTWRDGQGVTRVWQTFPGDRYDLTARFSSREDRR